jgi:hypothetical protein
MGLMPNGSDRWTRRRNMAVVRVGDVKTMNCDQSVLKVSRFQWRDDVQSQAMFVDASGIIWLMFHDYMLDTEKESSVGRVVHPRQNVRIQTLAELRLL